MIDKGLYERTITRNEEFRILRDKGRESKFNEERVYNIVLVVEHHFISQLSNLTMDAVGLHLDPDPDLYI